MRRLFERLRQRFCRHQFVLFYSNPNDPTKVIHKCPKCGKLFYTRLS